ncbi:SURF1 family protein [Jiella sp. CQZ9-1]|uniref:SURF1-like protein n=1 Tax=Jiella flava TaxID=2816857 RepID=A0A939G168_9HYPH|nr:SURF1 family protein [Jiella flava]
MDPGAARERRPRSRFKRALLALAGLILFAGFIGLGIWQLERRVWKLNLIAAVNARVAAAPVPAPGPKDWGAVSFDSDEYRHVAATGRFVKGASAFAQATTDYGGGFWLMTPLKDERGFTVLVNRGFVPSRDFAADAALTDQPIAVNGLLRMSQPGGGFLRANDPADGRWYSRDVAAIAKTERVDGPVAPYFIDAGSPRDHQPLPNVEMGVPDTTKLHYPIPGLTRIYFRNEHLVYAFTWFGMALLVLIGAVVVVRQERREDV